MGSTPRQVSDQLLSLMIFHKWPTPTSQCTRVTGTCLGFSQCSVSFGGGAALACETIIGFCATPPLLFKSDALIRKGMAF